MKLIKNIFRKAPEIVISFFAWLFSIVAFLGEFILFRNISSIPAPFWERELVLATICFGMGSFLLLFLFLIIFKYKKKLHIATLLRAPFVFTLLFTLLILSSGTSFALNISINKNNSEKALPTVRNYSAVATITVTPSPTAVSTTTQAIDTNPQEKDTTPWGVAKQVKKDEWTMKIGQDTVMATPQEVFIALNHYRNTKGISSLNWDNNLANYAQSRADMYIRQGKSDDHEGFYNFIDNGGFETLGFHSLGENSSTGYREQGVHLIEWIFAADPGHDGNQLNSQWTHVGIGINGTAVDIIFGGNKY